MSRVRITVTAWACGPFGRRLKSLARAMDEAPDASSEMIELVALRVSEAITREIKDGLYFADRSKRHDEKAALIRETNAPITLGQG